MFSSKMESCFSLEDEHVLILGSMVVVTVLPMLRSTLPAFSDRLVRTTTGSSPLVIPPHLLVLPPMVAGDFLVSEPEKAGSIVIENSTLLLLGQERSRLDGLNRDTDRTGP
jgi:hypothetical protein